LSGRTPLPERMQTAAICHVGVAGDLAVLRAVVSSTAEWVLGCSTGETSRKKVMSELAGQFKRLEELCP
jgi:hypothetical protein